MNFEYYTASRIIFGEGTFNTIGKRAAELGNNALIVLGGGSLRKNGTVNRLCSFLQEAGVTYCFYEGIAHEPESTTVDEGVEITRKYGVNLVIGIGGGSVIDTGKAISGLVTNGGSVRQYLEGVGDGSEITKPALPYIAVPTTAGTGAEVTKNAVISSVKEKFKKSIRSQYLIPRIALVDPLLTLDVPLHVTAAVGMDALTQLIEPYVSRKAQPMTDALALHGIPFIARSLPNAVKNGHDAAARRDMCLGSLLSGIALANSGLGAAHGIAAALGAHFDVPHGLACGIMLPHVMEINMPANRRKFSDIGEALTGIRYDSIEKGAVAGVQFVKQLAKEVGMPGDLKGLGIEKKDIPALVKGSRGSSMNGNPVELTDEMLKELLERLI